MQPAENTRAWLLTYRDGVEPSLRSGGHTYDDVLSSHYSYDSNVKNCEKIRPGDIVVLWDTSNALGASVVSSVTSGPGKKRMRYCPNCGSPRNIRRRSEKGPFICELNRGCGHRTMHPRYDWTDLTVYSADYEEAFLPLSLNIPKEQVHAACDNDNKRLSIRGLSWQRFSNLLQDAPSAAVKRTLDLHAHRFTKSIDFAYPQEPPGGFSSVMARARIGQASFRAKLISQFGSVCAFTGPSPLATLEAAHLYSYAAVGLHHEHGGILLRRDLHSLFDQGLIRVSSAHAIELDQTLLDYPQYALLDGKSLEFKPNRAMQKWFETHRTQHSEHGWSTQISWS